MPQKLAFLSSTCYELTDLRFSLKRFLLSNNFLVQMSEDPESEFTVQGTGSDSIETCLLNVERSDVVVCVIDRRYGGILPATHTPNQFGMQSSERTSATHLELLKAKHIGKPLFVFLRKSTLNDLTQLHVDNNFRPKWIEANERNTAHWLRLFSDIRSLNPGVANWYDTFETVVDLQPLVLKRLTDQFKNHVPIDLDKVPVLTVRAGLSGNMNCAETLAYNVGGTLATWITYGFKKQDGSEVSFSFSHTILPSQEKGSFSINFAQDDLSFGVREVFLQYSSRANELFRTTLKYDLRVMKVIEEKYCIKRENEWIVLNTRTF